jgi:hypothetical protein
LGLQPPKKFSWSLPPWAPSVGARRFPHAAGKRFSEFDLKEEPCRSSRNGRGGEDYVEISLDSEFRYNPLHNDLDAYALAFNIASLLNNLFGRGKEPFWQQAYTNLVKFITLLHKVAYDYVTLFSVYECAISPPLLEHRIQEAEEMVM